MKRYSVDYFIKKFKAIPASKWSTCTLENIDGQRCALGHCGVRIINRFYPPEAAALINYIECYTGLCVSNINDGFYPKLFPQKTSKARILAALRDVKKAQSKEKKQ